MTKADLPALQRPLVFLGMMGCGKSSLGQRVAERLGVPFFDADAEIEKAAQMSVAEIFESHGEAAFRDGERRVIARLLDGPVHVLALGGGAFVNDQTRALIKQKGLSVWLDVPLDELVDRVSRKPGKRPLLVGTDIASKLSELMQARTPHYGEADIRLPLGKMSHQQAVDEILAALDKTDRIA